MDTATPPNRRSQGGAPSFPSQRQHYLPELLFVLEMAMRVRDLLQRKGPIDYRLDLPAEDEFQHLMQLAHRPHEAAEEAPLLVEEEAQVDGRVKAGGRAARHQTPRWRERLRAFGP